VIMDAPAGVAGLQLGDYVQRVDCILVPVLPSPIDIHAAAHFIQDLLLLGKVRPAGVRLAVVANRVRENTRVFRDLQRFLLALNVPFVATLRDSQNHIRAAEQGLAIHELEASRSLPDRERWAPLIQWLEAAAGQSPAAHGLVAPIGGKPPD